MDRCPKDEPTAKNLVCRKALHIPEKNWEKNVLGGGGGVVDATPLAIGGLNINHTLIDWFDSFELSTFTMSWLKCFCMDCSFQSFYIAPDRF